MTTGELFASHSSAPSGSTALYNLETLCQEGGCGEYGLIPITDILCNLVSKNLDADLATTTFNCDLQIVTLNAILSTEVLSADLDTKTLDGEILCR